MNFVCVAFELCDKMLTLSSMENLIVPCNPKGYPAHVGADFVTSLMRNVKVDDNLFAST